MTEEAEKLKVTTLSRYGLRALVDLAAHSRKGYVSLASIAERQGISQKYLENIFKILTKTGIAESVKGAHGGYRVVDEALEIPIGKILQVLESNLQMLPARRTDELIDGFLEEFLWKRLSSKVEDLLNSITLKDLVDEYVEMVESNSLTYYI